MDNETREQFLKEIDRNLRLEGKRLPKRYKKVSCDYCGIEKYGTTKLPNGLRQCRDCKR